MEFWNDIATDRSWDVLIKIKKEIDFILIGGWACYLLTKTIKSKDIDIIIDFETLEKIRTKYMVKKTDFLKKYEMKIEDTSIDIYLPYYSKFVLPVEFVQKNSMSMEGLKIPKPEVLLLLKQQAEFDRKDSVKGQKDRTDILNLLLNADMDFKEYKKIITEFHLKEYHKRLKEIIANSKKEFEYLGIKNLRKIKLIKKDLLNKLSFA